MLPKEKCVGCSACMHACPQKCITMQPNLQGFLYPEIDTSLCIECGICEKVCQVNHPVVKYDLPKKIYAARIKDENVLQRSSSGGVAWLLAKEIIQNKGVVYGAAFDKNMVVQHIRVTDLTGLKRIQGSKYSQSNIQQIYLNIKQDLDTDKKVLMFGTPCQIAGVRKVFGENKNLLLCDVICLGAPSPKIFADHIRAIESKGKKVSDYRFRDKVFGWSYSVHRILYRDGSAELHSYWNQCYKRLFFLNLIYREGCYNCIYSDCKRTGDITLGDFWGIEKITDKFADDKGVNVVFFNTTRAISEFEKTIKDKTIYIETTIENALQKSLIMPCGKSSKVDEFWNFYKENSYKAAAEKFAGKYYYLMIRNRLKDFLIKYHILSVKRKSI